MVQECDLKLELLASHLPLKCGYHNHWIHRGLYIHLDNV